MYKKLLAIRLTKIVENKKKEFYKNIVISNGSFKDLCFLKIHGLGQGSFIGMITEKAVKYGYKRLNVNLPTSDNVMNNNVTIVMSDDKGNKYKTSYLVAEDSSENDVDTFSDQLSSIGLRIIDGDELEALMNPFKIDDTKHVREILSTNYKKIDVSGSEISAAEIRYILAEVGIPENIEVEVKTMVVDARNKANIIQVIETEEDGTQDVWGITIPNHKFNSDQKKRAFFAHIQFNERIRYRDKDLIYPWE
jgi:hypothetical protein